MAKDLSVRTVTYGRAGETDLLAEVYRHADPSARRRHGVVMVHGGAWTTNDRLTPAVMCEDLARAGFTVFSLDFRDGRNGKHPCAVQDITAGIRYVRANAVSHEVDANRISLIGSSSGGHLVLLAATQPDVEKNRSTAFMVDGGLASGAAVSAQVCCVTALWPVSDPLRRYRYAGVVGRDELRAAHLKYFRDEPHMHEASVQRSLRAGEATHVPPLMLVQPGEDANVPRGMTLDLVQAYQESGGELHYRFLPGLPHAFAYQASVETTQLAGEVREFLTHHSE